LVFHLSRSGVGVGEEVGVSEEGSGVRSYSVDTVYIVCT
jgi:hypothetical protein